MDKKAFAEGAAVGILAGIIGTILLAPKSGKETRDDIKGHLEEIRDQIADRFAAAGETTKKQYEEIVAAVLGEYETAKKITLDEAEEIKTRLHGCYEELKGAADTHAETAKKHA